MAPRSTLSCVGILLKSIISEYPQSALQLACPVGKKNSKECSMCENFKFLKTKTFHVEFVFMINLIILT